MKVKSESEVVQSYLTLRMLQKEVAPFIQDMAVIPLSGWKLDIHSGSMTLNLLFPYHESDFINSFYFLTFMKFRIKEPFYSVQIKTMMPSITSTVQTLT